MAAMGERHSENRIAGLQEGHEDCHVRLSAGVRLDVGMICAEDLFQPLERERFGDVDPLTAAVIPLARIAFRVFVGHHAGVGFAYRPAGVVLRSDRARGSLFAGVPRPQWRQRLRGRPLRCDSALECPLLKVFGDLRPGDLRFLAMRVSNGERSKIRGR